jgi:glycosyltransferase involved in cell wall biosynthesis
MKSAVCLIVRNEARDIAEWMAFHAVAGFDTQIIFDNRSDDGTTEIVKAACGTFDIRYHDWPNTSAGSQVLAYEAACAAYRLEFDWIAFVDSDEFVTLTGDVRINDFLARFEGWSGIALNWAIFGANGHEDFPEGLVVENFIRRAGPDFFPARHAKSIIRPGFADRCLNPHCFDLRGDRLGSYAGARGRRMVWWPAPELGGILPGVTMAPPDYGVARVNHYFTRSRAHFLAKVRRGYPSDIAIRTAAEFEMYNRNDIEDTTACSFIREIRASLAILGSAA